MGESTARIPRVGSSTAKAPGVGVSFARRPGVGVSVAPPGSVPPRYVTLPSIVGDASMRFFVSASAVGVASVDAPASMRMAVSTELETEIKMIDVEARMIVTAESVVTPAVDAPAAMTVDAATVVTPVIESTTYMPVAASAVTALAPTPMGMDKDSSAFSAPSGSGFASPTGWVTRSGYLSTVIEGSALKASVSGSYTIHTRVTFQASATGNRVRILVNGTPVATSEAGTATPSTTVTMTLAAGDLVSMECASNGGSTTRVVLSGPTNTYLYFDVA